MQGCSNAIQAAVIPHLDEGMGNEDYDVTTHSGPANRNQCMYTVYEGPSLRSHDAEV